MTTASDTRNQFGGELETRLQVELARAAAIDKFRSRSEKETGWDRVKELFRIKNFQFSPEMEIPIVTGKISLAMGFLVGAMDQWLVGKDIFIERNKATKFLNQKDFMRNAMRFQLIFAARAGMRVSFRLTAFGGLYSLLATSLAMYTNELSLKEYAGAGCITGLIYQSRVGINGALVGSALGLLLSVPIGLMSDYAMKRNNVDFATIRYDLHFKRQELWKQYQERLVQEEADAMLQEAIKDLKDLKEAPSTKTL